MSSEENEFSIPFSESRKGREPELEEKALGRRLASYVSSRLVDRPNIGRRRGGRDRGDLDIPTGGKPGKRKPTGSRRDPDNDGWADEGSTNPIWVGIDGQPDQRPSETESTLSSGMIQVSKLERHNYGSVAAAKRVKSKKDGSEYWIIVTKDENAWAYRNEDFEDVKNILLANFNAQGENPFTGKKAPLKPSDIDDRDVLRGIIDGVGSRRTMRKPISAMTTISNGKNNEVLEIQTAPFERRQGLAAELFNTFRETFPDLNLQHSDTLTEDGKRFAAATPAGNISEEESQRLSSGIAATLMQVWDNWNASDPDNLQLTKDILANALTIAGAESLTIEDAIAKVIKRLVGKDKRKDGETAVPRPLNGLLYTLRNFHQFYGLKHRSEDRTLDSEGQSISTLSDGAEGLTFSSGATFDAEVEKRQLSDERQILAEDISDAITNDILPSIAWQSGPLKAGNRNIGTEDRYDIADFLLEPANDNMLYSIAELFGGMDDEETVSIELERDLSYTDQESGKTINLGRTVVYWVGGADAFVKQSPSHVSTIQNIDSGADISMHGDALHYDLQVSLSAPGSVLESLWDDGYDPPSIGNIEFAVRVSNTGTSVYVTSIQVSPEFKDAGVARAVMADAENAWRTIGANAIYLTGRSSVTTRQAKRIDDGEIIPLSELEYTGASYWALNGYEWDGAQARDKMLSALFTQLKLEETGEAKRTYFSQSDRERLLSKFDVEDDGYVYSSLVKAEDLMQSADRKSLTRFFAERDLTAKDGFYDSTGLEVPYRRIIDEDAHKESQNQRLALALKQIDKKIVDEWSLSPTNSRNAANESRIPLSVSSVFPNERARNFLSNNITWLENLYLDNGGKFSSGDSISLNIERHGDEEPFDIPVGFKVGDRQFNISTGGDSPGRDQYNGYLAAFDENGKLAGYLDYNSESRENTAVVAMIEVNKEFQRMGIGSALLDALRITLPDYEISPGYTTDDGGDWWKAVTGGTGPIKGPRRGAALNINDRRPNKSSVPGLSSGLSDAPWSPDDKYRGFHLAPDRTSGAPMHNMADGIYPEDLYGVNGARVYGFGDPRSEEVMSILRSVHNKPDSLVTVYRAVPLSTNERLRELEKQQSYIRRTGKIPPYLDSADMEDSASYYNNISREIEMLRNAKHIGSSYDINAGDWVTPIKSYAREHGNSNLGGRGNYRIVQKRVPAKHLFTEGNSLLEFGYDPDDNPNRLSSGSTKPPIFPREPSYGPYLGEAERIFGDARTWRELRDSIRKRDIIFVDYETTGLVTDEFREVSGNGKPVQIALIKMRDGRVIDELNLFMNPGEPLGEWSSKNLFRTDGEQLTDDWLAEQMSMADAHRLVADFSGPNALFGVQNARFDKNVLEDALANAGIEWRPSGYIDTMDIAQMVLPRYSEASPDGPYMEKNGERVPSSSLKAITQYLGVSLEKHHSAEHDALAAGMALFAMINQAEDRGWDSLILDRSRRLDFIDKRTQKFETARRDFDDKKRQFLESRDMAGDGFSSGASGRPIIRIPERSGSRDATQDTRQRPLIQIQPMDRDTKEKLQRHQARNYAYGDTSELGQQITINAARPLWGLTSKQIANIIVPDSEDTYLKMLADSYTPIGMPVSDMDRALRLTALRGEYERQKIKYGAEIDFSPESISRLRNIVSDSLDEIPALKWGMENFGAPPIVQLITSSQSVAERAAAFYTVVTNTISVTPRYIEAVTSTGDFAGKAPLPMSVKSLDPDRSTISYSVSGILAHEWGHYLHYSLMAHSQSPYNQYYKVDDVGPFLSGLQHGLGDVSSPQRIRAMSVAEKYFFENWKVEYDESVRPFRRISPETPRERFEAEQELQKTVGNAFGDSWKNDPQPLVRGKYGSSEPLEAIAEAAAAILHPDKEFTEQAINNTLRQDFFAMLGLDDRSTPWDEMLERDRIISTGSIGVQLRNAHRERMDLARRDINDQGERAFSSGRGMQSRMFSDEFRGDVEKLAKINKARGLGKTGVLSSFEMEKLGPSRRELSALQNVGFSSGVTAQNLYPGAYTAPDAKLPIGREYTNSFGDKVEAFAEVHQIGDEKIIFGRLPDEVMAALGVDGMRLVPLNPYEISGYSKTSEDGIEIALQWASARAAHVANTENIDSTYVDALLYAGVRGDDEAMDKFNELASQGTQLIDDARQKALREDNARGSEGTRASDLRSAKSQQIDQYGIDQMFLVHETSWGINRDDDGNVVLRPAGDYGPIRMDNGGEYHHHRQTLHFSINHLAVGHAMRERKDKSHIIVVPLRNVIEDNPGALENLFVIDSWLVPRPGEGLVLRDARIIENDGSSANLDEQLGEILESSGSSLFDGGFVDGSGSNPGQDFIVQNIAQDLGVTSRMHWTSSSRFIEQLTVDKEVSRPPTSAALLGDLSTNHIARIGDTTSRFTAYTTRSTEESLASGSMRRIDEMTGRTFGGVAVSPRTKPRLRRSPKRNGISERDRRAFMRRERSFSSGDGDVQRIGTVSISPVAVVRGKRYAIDERSSERRFNEQQTEIPVHNINGEQVAFTRDVIDAPGVKRVPVNPYAITNLSPDSESGRRYARTWFMATVAQISEDRNKQSLTSALLYAAVRGDLSAEKELNRLAESGEQLIKEGKAKYSELSYRGFGGTRRTSERTAEWWKDNYPGSAIITVPDKNDEWTKETRLIQSSDLFAVHQTSYKPKIDKDGNLILRPTGDYDYIDDTGNVVVNPNNGQPLRAHRHTVHFSLNHLVTGHIYRQAPVNENYAIVVSLDKMLDSNPGSVDNIYSVDTYLTPKPGEGLVIPKGSYKLITLPAVSTHTGKNEPMRSYAERTRQEQDEWSNAVSETVSHHQDIVTAALEELGRELTDNPNYQTVIFRGGDDGVSDAIDARIFDIAHNIGVTSRMHNGSAVGRMEDIGISSQYASVGSIFSYDIQNFSNADSYPTFPNNGLHELSDNAILRIADNDRFTTSTDFYEPIDEFSNFLAGPRTDDDDGEFESGGQNVMPGIFDVATARSIISTSAARPEKLEIDASWIRDGFDLEWLRSKFPNMHFGISDMPWNRGMYVPMTGELQNNASWYDKLSDVQRMSGYLRRHYWHPAMVDPQSDLGGIIQSWRSDFSESRALTRAIGGLDVAPEFVSRGEAFRKDVEILRAGLQSAPELGFETYRVARLTPDVGPSARVGDELTFNAAAVAVGVNAAAEYDIDELSSMNGMNGKYLFEFPSNTNGLLFDEEGLAALNRPSAKGGESGPVEGIISGRFRVASIKQVNVKNRYSAKESKRDVIVLEKLSSGSGGETSSNKNPLVITTDDGIIAFTPGLHRDPTSVKQLQAGVKIMSSQDLMMETTADVELLPNIPESVSTGYLAGSRAKNFVTTNVARSVSMQALDIVDLFADNGENTPSGVIIRPLFPPSNPSQSSEYFTKRAGTLQFVPDGENFMAAWVVRDSVDSGGDGAFIKYDGKLMNSSLVISTDEDTISKMKSLTLETRRAIHETFIQPLIDGGLGKLVRDLMSDPNNMPPDSPDGEGSLIKPLSIRFNNEELRASGAAELGYKVGGTLFLALGGRLDENGNIPREHMALVGKISTLYRDHRGIAEMISSYVQNSMYEIELGAWTDTETDSGESLSTRRIITASDLNDALRKIGPDGQLPPASTFMISGELNRLVPLRTGSEDSWSKAWNMRERPESIDFVPDEAFRKEWFGGQLIDKNHPEFDQVLKQAIISDIVRTWAISSNDANPVGLAIQNVARRLFAADDAVGWQLEFNHDYGPPDSSAIYMGSLKGEALDIALKDKLDNQSRAFDAAPELSEKQELFLTQVLRAMHTATQEYYKSKGITHIPVFRGVALNAEQAGYEVSKDKTAAMPGFAMWTDDVAMRPLSSWTTSYVMAQSFSETGLGGGNRQIPHMLFSVVPVDQVLCNPFTGFGCLDEDEIVLIGKPIKTLVAQTDPKIADAADLGKRMARFVAVHDRVISGDINWKEFELPKQLPEVEVRGTAVPRRDQVGKEKFSSGGLPEYIKNPTARLIAGLGKIEGVKSVDADMRKPTSDLDIAKSEGRPISWLLNETIDPELGQIIGELVDDLLRDKQFREYFETRSIHPFKLGETDTGQSRMDGSSGDHHRNFMVALIKLNAELQINHPELSGSAAEIIARGLAERAGITAMRTMWIEREAKKIGIRVDELIDKMINQTRRLQDYELQLNEVDSVVESGVAVSNNIKRGINDIDRVVIAVDLRAMFAMSRSPKEKQRILSQFEARRSNGAYDTDARAQQEVSMFGYHPDMDPSKRPIYGFAAYGGINEQMAYIGYQYGEYLAVLKQDVNDRTTVTEIDSLSQMATSSSMRSPGMGMRAMIDVYSDDGTPMDNEYIEAQVHSVDGKNGVSIDDIEYILLRDDVEGTDDELGELQEKLGIPVRRLSEELQNGFTSDYDGLSYVDESDLG